VNKQILKPNLYFAGPIDMSKLLIMFFSLRFTATASLLVAISSSAIASDDANLPMSFAENGDVNIAYRVVGDQSAEPVVMIMGLSASHKVWHSELIEGIVNGGYRVVLLDNRDVGESTRIKKRGRIWLAWQLLKYRFGLKVKSPYSLQDMAEDTIAVLEQLEIEQAHIVGASMGGMIAQTVAYNFPERTQSLVSIMSTTWAPHLPPPGREQEQGISDMNESSAEQTKDLEKIGFYPGALPNQVTAILSAGDRTKRVEMINAPTLVLHGADDELLSLEHGEHTAEIISGAKLKIYKNMGHSLPDHVIPEMVSDIVDHLRIKPTLASSE
jgi:pimeloyl-ACP methyl ester carboxylesterase